MSTANVKALTRRLYDEVFTGGNLELIDVLLHDDFVEHEEFPGLPPGKEAVRYFVTATQGAFPDLTVDVEDVIAEDNKVASRLRFSGTHKGEFMGIPATGNKIDFQVIDILAFRDSKATDHWGVTDQLAMLTQLGVVESPV
jgi:steroid delta-isomerase-like uncharacterized protein